MTLFIQSIILMLAIALISQCQDRSGAGGHADTVHWENISLEPDEYIFFVNSYRVECTGVGPQTCWQVKKGKDARIENKPWTLLYEPISGLDWEPGYRYTLIVREDRLPADQIPADGSAFTYTLQKLLAKEPDPTIRLHDIWALLTIDGRGLESFNSSERPVIEIQLTSGRVMGFDGCNQYNGKIQKVTSDDIQFSPLITTRKGCPDMDIPHLFHKKMEKVTGYDINNLILSLTDQSGRKLMTFQKVD